MYQGTRYYIQRPTGYMKEGEPEWVDMEFEPGQIWRSGRFTSAADQVNDWRDAATSAPSGSSSGPSARTSAAPTTRIS